MSARPTTTFPPRIGFVGLGDMGAPMAERMIGAGTRLTFHARRPEVVDRFRARGGRPVGTLRELGVRSDVVEIVVTGDDAVRDVVLGDNLLAGMRPGSVIVIHSTIDPHTCRHLAAPAAARGVALIDAPVSGGRQRAERGDLTVLLGGDVATCERVAPLFAPFASLVRRMGPLGAGQVAKLVNNYFALAHEATAHAAVRLIAQLGLDVPIALEVLSTCSGSSERFKVLASAGAFVHPKGDAVRLAMMREELQLVRRLAAQLDVKLGPSEGFIASYVESEGGTATGAGSD